MFTVLAQGPAVGDTNTSVGRSKITSQWWWQTGHNFLEGNDAHSLVHVGWLTFIIGINPKMLSNGQQHFVFYL